MAYVPHAKIDLFAADDVFGKRLKYLQPQGVFEEEPTNTAMAAARHFLMAHANIRDVQQKPVDIAHDAMKYEWQITPSASMLSRRLVDHVAADGRGVSQASSHRQHGGKKRSSAASSTQSVSHKFSFATDTGNMVNIRATFLLKDASLPTLDALLPASAVPNKEGAFAPIQSTSEQAEKPPAVKHQGSERSDTNMSSRTLDGPTGKLGADAASLAGDARSITSNTLDQELPPVLVPKIDGQDVAPPGWGAGSFVPHKLDKAQQLASPSMSAVETPLAAHGP